MHQLSGTQRFFLAILPKKWAASMEKESRMWKVVCSCGHEVSVWDSGGIRWKAAGNPRRYGTCSGCGKKGWLTVVKNKSYESSS